MKAFFLSAVAISQLLSGVSAANFRWKGFCIDGPTLTPWRLDRAAQHLRDWAASNPTIESHDQNWMHREWSDNVLTYACSDSHHHSETFSVDDINNALRAMDLNCPRYQPSWAILEHDNNGEFDDDRGWLATAKIIGKSWMGTPVCQGAYGGMKDGDKTGGGAIYI